MSLKTKEKWEKIQTKLKLQLNTTNTVDQIQYVGGVDISFDKTNSTSACASLVVLNVTTQKIVYQKCKLVTMKEEYIPGFLAFREVKFLVDLINELKQTNSQLIPQVIFVDGNGILHPRGFGLASHLGVLVDIPTIGIGKNLLFVDGLTKSTVRTDFDSKCHQSGDFVNLQGQSGQIWGVALKSTITTINPIFISVGHKINLTQAIELTKKYTNYRVPEPVRQADIISRALIRTLNKK